MPVSKILLASAVFSIAAIAAPHPQIFGNDPTYYCPLRDSEDEIAGTPWQIGLSVPGGDTISVTETHSVGTTWTIGGDLGISAGGVSAGISASVSETVTDSVGEGTSAKCPDGPWHCSMQIVPSVALIKGHTHQQNNDETCPTNRCDADDGCGEGTPFEFTIPIKDSSGNGKWTYDVCACQNLEHWADPGAPSVVCPEECTPHE